MNDVLLSTPTHNLHSSALCVLRSYQIDRQMDREREREKEREREREREREIHALMIIPSYLFVFNIRFLKQKIKIIVNPIQKISLTLSSYVAKT